MTDNKDMSKGQPTASDAERRAEKSEEEQKSFRLLDNHLSFKLIR